MAAATGRPTVRREAEATALERLFERLLPGLVRWTRGRLPPRARRRLDSSDLVQEALIGALRHLPDLEHRESAVVRAYALQSIRNRIRDELRRADLCEVAAGERDDAPDRGPSPLDEAIRSEDRDRLRSALLRLAPRERELVAGRLELGLDYRELAAATGRPSADAARMATRRAMLKLERLLRED